MDVVYPLDAATHSTMGDIHVAGLDKVLAYKSKDPIIHLARDNATTTLCGRRAVWNVNEPYVRATCDECKALATRG
jgi:hypothetical protein